MEKKRRGREEKLIVRGESTKKPDSWKCFLANDDNKRQLVKVMLDVWSNDRIATKLHGIGREEIFICEGFAYLLKSNSGETTEPTEVQQLHSTQEETDSRIIAYCMYARDHGNNNRLIDITNLAEKYTPMYCSAYMAMHAYTNCDTTSSFKGIGKIKPLKRLSQNPILSRICKHR